MVIFPGFLVCEIDRDDTGKSFFDDLVHPLVCRRQQRLSMEHFRADRQGGGCVGNFDFDAIISQEAQSEFAAVIGCLLYTSPSPRD